MKRVWLLGLAMTFGLQARYHEVKRVSEFDRLVAEYDMSVICFAPSTDHDLSDKDTRKQYRDVMRMLKNASDRDEFRKLLGRDIGFLMVDTSRNDMREVAVQNHIDTEPLCFVLHQDTTATGKQQTIKPATSYDLIKLLYDVGGTHLQDLIRDKKEDKRLEREERIAYWNAYPGWYGYYGWGGPAGWGWGGRRGLSYGWSYGW